MLSQASPAVTGLGGLGWMLFLSLEERFWTWQGQTTVTDRRNSFRSLPGPRIVSSCSSESRHTPVWTTFHRHHIVCFTFLGRIRAQRFNTLFEQLHNSLPQGAARDTEFVHSSSTRCRATSQQSPQSAARIAKAVFGRPNIQDATRWSGRLSQQSTTGRRAHCEGSVWEIKYRPAQRGLLGDNLKMLPGGVVD